ncbi:MAG: fibrobacter succinogenes major paralogous domain-containing protein [Bacteroidales bacterium]|nr:fibrobacter succinogenes major paralogous domain-containing protein [Bacteroidales bacterium]
MRQKNCESWGAAAKIKKILLILSILLSVFWAKAQTDSPHNFAHGFSSATNNAENVSYSFGQLFTQQVDSALYSVDEGVMQAQLIRLDMKLAGPQNDSLAVSPTHVQDTSGFFNGYAGIEKVFNGKVINVFPEGHYDSTSTNAAHYSWKANFNYDSLTTLVLDVWPIYELFDTLYLDSVEILTDYAHNILLIPDTIHQTMHGGPNTYMLKTTEHSADSIRHFYVHLCGGLVADADGNKYASLYVGNPPRKYCWTKSNLKTTTYVSGGHVPNMIYYSDEQNDTVANLETYGRLYNWYAAVNLPKGSDNDPPTTLNGSFVTGICPAGWHIPDSLNMLSLNSINAFDLMANILWLIPGNDTGAGFYALPAGYYSHITKRFENMLGETYFWSCVRRNLNMGWVCSLVFGCNLVIDEDLFVENGLSVRCVKNQIYDDTGKELND